MVWTRDEVDKYVAKMEKTVGSATEKNLKGFAFARLYREARDMDKATRHLEAYISVNEGDFRGHRMMGQMLEETGNLEKALSFYRRSLELDNTQNDLVLKVVELYCSVPVHPERARAWADRAARLVPGHPAVFRLRMHLLESAGKLDYEEIEDLIAEEMTKRPKEVQLHIRLVRLYSSTGRLAEAFSHCVSVIKTKAFESSLEWWSCAVEIIEKYMAVLEKSIKSSQEVGCGHVILEAHMNLLLALSCVVCLQLTHSETNDCTSSLYRFDHCLFTAFKRRVRATGRSSRAGIRQNQWEVVLQEMSAQLYMHLGTLIIRLAREHYLTWPRALKLCSVCYVISLETTEPDMQTPWVARALNKRDALRWYNLACSRRSLVGHFVLVIKNRHGQDWLDTTLADCCSPQGHDDIITTVYQNRRDLAMSYLTEDSKSFSLGAKLPTFEELIKYDEVAICEHPHNLQLITWIGLHWYQYEKTMRPGVGVVVSHLFDGLRMDVPNIEQTHAHLLCLRDLEAFIYAVVRTAVARLLDDKDVYYEDFQPKILPFPLCSQLSFTIQDEWWSAAYSLYSGTASLNKSGKVRSTVQCGIEVIRALTNHGLHVKLLIYLANTFADKATYLKTFGVSPWFYEEHWKSLRARSIHYWRQSLKLLEKIERNESIGIPTDPLFPQLQDYLQETDIKNNLQVARMALGEAAVREGDYGEAMELYEQVKTTQGIWNLAQIYKYLASVEAQAASEETDVGPEGLYPPTRPSQEYYNCLGKARELLLGCWDNLEPNRRQQNVQEEIADLEDMLNDDHVQPRTRKQLDFRQLDHQPSYSSTVVSDAQESEDNFWVEQPQDSSTKDLIAKLSEVTLNNGYLQEQMTMRDHQLMDLTDHVRCLQFELNELKSQRYSSVSTSTPPERGSLQDLPFSQLESTPLSKPSFAGRVGTNGDDDHELSPDESPCGTPGEVKIDSLFFAGLSKTNTPKEEDVSEDERERLDSTGDDIHFEPVIPLPEKVEVKTGEEDEDVLFSERAKLFRFDKECGAWKERGVGVIKILRHQTTNQSRVVMRRDHVHKICTNHVITQQMELKPKLGSKNSWVYTTLADFADEICKIEQLAVKFKTPDDADLFKEKFEQCQRSVPPEQSAANQVQSSSSRDVIHQQEELRAKFAPKAGSWPCAVCDISNEQSTTICVACGASRLDVTTSPATLPATKPISNFSLDLTAPTTSPFAFEVPASGSTPVTSIAATMPQPQVSKAAFFSLPPPVSRSPVTPPVTSEMRQFGGTASSGASPFTFKVDSRSLVGNADKDSKEEEPTNVFGGTSSDKLEKQPLTFGGFTSSSLQIGSPKPDVATTSTQTPPHKCEKCESGTTQEISSPTGMFVLNNLLPAQMQAPVGQPPVSQPPVELPIQQAATAKTSPFSLQQTATAMTSAFALQQTATTMTSPFASPQSVATQKLFWPQPQSAPVASPAPFGVPTDGAQQNIWYPAAFALNQMAQQASPTHSPIVTPPVSVTASPTRQPFILNPQSMKTSPFVLSQTQPVSDATKSSWFPPSAPPQQPASTEGYNFKPYVVEEQTLQATPWSTTPQLPQRSTLIVKECNSHEYNEDAEQDENAWESDYETESETGSYETTSSGSSDNAPLSNRQPERPERPGPETAYTPPTTLVTPQKLLQSIAANKGDSPVFQPSPVTGRPYLRARAPLRQANKPDTDGCVIIYEVRPSKADREKAAKLLLPLTFYNYIKFPPCPGCQGCRDDIDIDIAHVNLNSHVKTELTASVDSPREPTSELAAAVFGKTFGAKTISFSDFASKAGTGAFGKKDTDSLHGFPRAGTQLFGEDEHTEEDNDGIYFEPIMPLPDEVDTVTGEEAEEVMFRERAKLYRFDDGTRQWKERGVGNIKLLTNPVTGRSRVVMRREQVLKVCANHCISQDMELKPGFGSDRSWVWHTLSDFTEGGVPTAETFAVRFKTADTAAHFKDIFDSLKERSVVPQETETKPKLNEDLGSLEQFAPPPDSWPCGDCLVQNEADNLRCVACGAIKPGAREKQPDAIIRTASSPANLQTAEATLPSLLPISKYDFGSTTFQPKPETVSQTQPGVTHGVSAVPPSKPDFGFMFRAQPQQVEQPESEFVQPKLIGQPLASREMKENDIVQGSITEASPTLVSLLQDNKSEKPEGFKFTPVGSGPPAVFTFGSGKTPLFTIGRGEPMHESDDEEDKKLGLIPSKSSSPPRPVPTGTPVRQNTTLPENIPSDVPFGRDLPVSFTFSLKASPTLPDRKPSTPKTPEESTVASPVSPKEAHPEAEDDGIHFEPIIPLPEKIEVRTGEESEETVFCNRAKLYRYDTDSSQWKEKGLGDFKILHDPETNRYRVLMRREHVLKICANHTITADMDLRPNKGSDKSWVWNTLADFADEVPKPETLAVKFKTKEIAEEFKWKFTDAQEVLPVQKESLVKVKTETELSSVTPEETKQQSFERIEGESSKDTNSEVCAKPSPGSTDDAVVTYEYQPSEEMIGKTGNVKGPEDQHEQDSSSPKELMPGVEDVKMGRKQPQVCPADTSDDQSQPATSGILFGSANITSLSFAAVGDAVSPSPFSKKTPEKSPKIKSPGFPRARRFSENEDEDDPERECDGIHFEPLIPLPEKIEVKTGEEDEDILFCHRAKLYRFDKSSKQWKERGVGDIKLLHDRYSGHVRVLMRRDQVHKICANHFVTADMELKPNAGSSKSWVWNTLADFADEEAKPEQLAVRFKNAETAEEFKEKFDHCRKFVTEQVEQQGFSKANEKGKGTVTEDLLAKFKPKPGSWDCDVCLVNNPPEHAACSACTTIRPGTQAAQNTRHAFGTVSPSQAKPNGIFGREEQVAKTEKATFNFTVAQHSEKPNQGESAPQNPFEVCLSMFKPKPGSWECESCLVRNDSDKTACNACGSVKPVVGAAADHQIPTTKPHFHFVAPALSSKPSTGFTFTFGTQPNASAEPKKPKFQFGSGITPGQKTDTAFTFAAPPTHSGSTPDTRAQNSFTFGAVPVTSTAATQSVEGVSSALEDALEKYKPKPDSWECDTCLISNNADVSSCAACGTLKPEATVTNSRPSLTFGMSSGTDDSVGPGREFASEASGGVFTFGGAPVSTSATPSTAFGSAAADKADDDDTFLKEETSQSTEGDSSALEDALEKYRPKPGSWECDTCLVSNIADVSACAACGTTKPGATATTSMPGLTFGMISGTDNSVGEKPGSGFMFGVAGKGFTFKALATDSIAEKPSFTFGVPTGSSEPQTITTPKFSFGAPLGMPAPGSSPSSSLVSPQDRSSFTFGDPIGSYFQSRDKDGESETKDECSEVVTDTVNKETQKITELAEKSVMTQSTDKEDQKKNITTDAGIETEDREALKTEQVSGTAHKTADKETQENAELAEKSVMTKSTDKEDQKKIMTADAGTETEDREALKTEQVSGTARKTADKETQENAELAEKSVMTDCTDNTWPVKSKTVDASTETLGEVALTKEQVSGTDIPSGEEHRLTVKDEVNGNKDNAEELSFVIACEPTTEEIRRAEKLLLPKAFFVFEREPEDQRQSETEQPASGSLTLSQACTKKDDNPDDLLEEQKNSTSHSENAFEEVAQHRSPVFGAGKPESSLSFAGIASSASEVGFAKPLSKGFAGKGSHLFGSHLRDEEHDPEQEDDLHFQPVIPLPEKIEVVSGEEDETALFCNRVKLYRYDKNTSQWKERGVGDLKILCHLKTKKPRILMRREQIHKICANHNITVDMQLRPNSGSDRSWMWQTLADFADEVPQAEQLAVRFKTVPLAQQFKTVFEECQHGLRDCSPRQKVHDIAAMFDTGAKLLPSKSKELTKQLSAGSMLFSVPEKVKPTQRGWKCKGCGVFNNEEISKCVACSRHKPPISKHEDAQFHEPVSVEEEPGNWECSTCYVMNNPDVDTCEACTIPRSTTRKEQGSKDEVQPDNSSTLETTKPQASAKLSDDSKDEQESSDKAQGTSRTSSSNRGTDDKLKEGPADKDDYKPDGETLGKLLFGSSDIGGLSFADIAKKSPSGPSLFGGTSTTKSRPFTGTGSQLFQSPTREDRDDEAAQSHDESGDHIYFEPVIPLPEKIEVKTGEEDEELVFKERCKLYRFDKDLKQWKERGVGDIKLLQEPKIKRARVVMRREQIHKLCANHLITADMELKPNAGSEKSWVWHTMADMSEGDARAEQLAVRFKSADSAREFKEKFDSLKDEGERPEEQDSFDDHISRSNTTEAIPVTDSTTVYKDEPREGKLEGSESSEEQKQLLSSPEHNQPDVTGDISPSVKFDTLPLQPLDSDVSNFGGKMIHSSSTSETTLSRNQLQSSSVSEINSSSVRQVQSSSVTQTRVVHQEVKSVQQVRVVQSTTSGRVMHTAASGKITGVEDLIDGTFPSASQISPIGSPMFASTFPNQAVTPMLRGVQDLGPSSSARALMHQVPQYPGMPLTQQLSRQMQEMKHFQQVNQMQETKQVHLSQQEIGHMTLEHQSVDRESRHVIQGHQSVENESRHVTQKHQSVESIHVRRVQRQTSSHAAANPTSPLQPSVSCSPEITRMLEEIGSSEDTDTENKNKQ